MRSLIQINLFCSFPICSYSNPLSSHQESMSLNGVTKGPYSYVDPNGVLQKVDYIADPVNGYQVLQDPVTSFLQDTPEVAEAKAQFFKLYQEQLDRVSS